MSSNEVESGTGGRPLDSAAKVTPETLAREYASTVLAICLVHARSLHDAEDITQEVFLKAMRSIDSLRDPARARPWLTMIARRACVDYYRSRPASAPLPEDLPARVRASDPRTERLHAAILALPEEYREVVALYYLDGRRSREVAEALDISEALVRQRLVRARLMLHERMSRDER